MKPSHTCHVIRAILRAVGSPARISPDFQTDTSLDLTSLETARLSFLGASIASKIRTSENTPIADAAALAKFLRREHENQQLNNRDFEDWILPYLFRARQIAHDILGEYVNPKELFRECEFTGGATTSRDRQVSHPAGKWWARPSLHVTVDAFPLLCAYGETDRVLRDQWSYPGYFDGVLGESDFAVITPGSRVKFVPKKADCSRPIIVEPDGNMFLQRGLGKMMRRRLLPFGIDLREQGRNREAARAASIHDDDATLDVADASSSLYTKLFHAVFPDDWFYAMWKLRSPITQLPDGSWHTLQMLCSTGCGFTFEAETVLFFSLVRAVCDIERVRGRVLMYGDDIVCPKGSGHHVIDVFEALGIHINRDKSFITGPFRESCGGNYYHGVDITPFYVRKQIESDHDRFLILNGFIRWVYGSSCYDGEISSEIRTVVDLILGQAPRHWVPESMGDDCGIHSPTLCPPVRARRSKRGMVSIKTRVLQRDTRNLRPCEGLRFLAAHVGVARDAHQDDLFLRSSTAASGEDSFLIETGDRKSVV